MALMFFSSSGEARGLQLQSVLVRAPAEYNSAFAAMTAGSAQALLILSTPMYTAGAVWLAELPGRSTRPMPSSLAS
jgi:hypothetical protein